MLPVFFLAAPQGGMDRDPIKTHAQFRVFGIAMYNCTIRQENPQNYYSLGLPCILSLCFEKERKFPRFFFISAHKLH